MTDAFKDTFSTRSPDVRWDAVVIGSGMGGMTTAAMLSKLGQRVLVLEKHYVPGGFTHTFKRKQWTFDVGVHAVGEVTEQALLGRLLGRLTDGRLRWESLGPVYDEFHFKSGRRIDFASQRSVWVDTLKREFPHEAAGIDAYIQEVKKVGRSMRGYFLSRALPSSLSRIADPLLARQAKKYFATTTETMVASFVSDPELQQLLTAQWGYYGSPPSRSSFAIHALTAKHFFHGAYYPRGGSHAIAQELLTTVKNAGGWTRIKAPVAEIIIRRGRAVGVRLESGEEIRAKSVVSAVGGLNTVERLLPDSAKKKSWAKGISSLTPSPAHFCVYLGFKGDIRSAGATAANKWFYDSDDLNIETWDFAHPEKPAPALYTSFNTLKDPTYDPGPEQIHSGEVITFVPYDAFERWQEARWMKRGDAYEALKTELKERVLKQFYKHMPQLEPMVAFSDVSTPVSTVHFTSAAKGAIYGIEPTPARFENRWLRPRTPVAGLFMSASDMASAGVMGAFVGGVLTALSMQPRRSVGLLRDVFAAPNPARPGENILATHTR